MDQTKASTKEKIAKQNETVTKCSILYKNAINETRKAGLTNVPNGTLRNIGGKNKSRVIC